MFIAVGGLFLRLLDTGVRILSQGEWEERERLVHRSLRGTSVTIDDGSLILPFLRGQTLAAVLEDRVAGDSLRARAVAVAVHALADFHRRGFTHADAMAENVMVDLECGDAHWFDFETVHDPGRPARWRRADDLRALVATCLLRTRGEQRAQMLDLILTSYPDEGMATLLAQRFSPGFARSLGYHLGQAPLSFDAYADIARLLAERARPGDVDSA